MADLLKPTFTRFRAYQLDQAGSSFSYFDGQHFTLIEGMATDLSKSTLLAEMRLCGKDSIDTLHITSWDADHCSKHGLQWVLETLKPATIEYPGYDPHTDCARWCLEQIRAYQQRSHRSGGKVKTVRIDPPYIASLGMAEGLGYRNIYYHPRTLFSLSNDNSSIKLFRTGMFNVLSLGDVQHANIGSMLRRCKILCRETDIVILAHHGADSGITTKKFLECVKPTVAVCTSNYDNQYTHPPQSVRNLLHEQEIQLVTTKTGDVIIDSMEPHRMHYRVTNLMSDSTKISSVRQHLSKKAHILSRNPDVVRNIYRPGFKGLRH